MVRLDRQVNDPKPLPVGHVLTELGRGHRGLLEGRIDVEVTQRGDDREDPQRDVERVRRGQLGPHLVWHPRSNAVVRLAPCALALATTRITDLGPSLVQAIQLLVSSPSPRHFFHLATRVDRQL